jgi:hypothetical protein
MNSIALGNNNKPEKKPFLGYIESEPKENLRVGITSIVSVKGRVSKQ